MASIGGSLPDDKRQVLNGVAREFGDQVRRLALSNSIPASAVRVWVASYFLAAVDQKSAHFVFAESASGTDLNYMDLTQFRDVSIERIAQDVRLQVGEPVWFFSVSEDELNSDEVRQALIRESAQTYIQTVLRSFQKDAVSMGEVDEQLCFVIMSFSGDPQLSDFYDHAIKPAVESAGYRCERVDEQHFNDSIRERILLNIRRAKFIVADMTEARPNCYYELGITRAMSKNVIHICRETKDIHFDIKDFNFIIYSRIDDLKQKLVDRIKHTVK